jgi:hypothetical protein
VKLSILCVTRAHPVNVGCIERLMDLALLCKDSELVLAADGEEAGRDLRYLDRLARVVHVRSRGYVESVLDEALDACQGEYVLRLDDDEQASVAMAAWLALENFVEADHWRFPRAWLWPDRRHYILAPPHWPDEQTRLSVRSKAGGRTYIHAGSPHGPGTLAPVAIEHHKLLLHSKETRRDLVAHYDSILAGSGTATREFYLPEDLRALAVAPWGAGDRA